jgi:hypothetical protein
MPRQYISCQFAGSKRHYTYHNDRAPVEVGDRVVVSTDRGPATVTVVDIWPDQPNFATKPIVGKESPHLAATPEPGSPGPLPGTVYGSPPTAPTVAPTNPFGPAKED